VRLEVTTKTGIFSKTQLFFGSPDGKDGNFRDELAAIKGGEQYHVPDAKFANVII
jgi:hypothetical protein